MECKKLYGEIVTSGVKTRVLRFLKTTPEKRVQGDVYGCVKKAQRKQSRGHSLFHSNAGVKKVYDN